MRSLNIVVAVISMAAGAWQGTTAQSGQSGSPDTAEHGRRTATSLTLRGCVQRGQAPGTFLIVTPGPATESGLGPASAPAARPHDAARPESSSTPGAQTSSVIPPDADAQTAVTYELVAGQPDVDLATLVGTRVEAHGTPERTAKGATADDSPTVAAAAADTPSGHTSAVGTTGSTARADAASQRSRVRVTTITALGGPCD